MSIDFSWSPLMEFAIQSAHQLEVSPIVKYTALSLFADRFFPSLTRYTEGSDGNRNWLLRPIRKSNLQLFALISLWISSKIHDSRPVSVKSFKSLGDKIIKEEHFTTRDFFEAVLDFEIGTSNIAFLFLEDLLLQFRGVAKIGELVSSEACMDLMDLLYEKEETSTLYRSPRSLAASVLVASYLITVPKQRWEFPVIPWGEGFPTGWLFVKLGPTLSSCVVLTVFLIHERFINIPVLVKFVTSCKEEDIVELVQDILKHVFEPI